MPPKTYSKSTHLVLCKLKSKVVLHYSNWIIMVNPLSLRKVPNFISRLVYPVWVMCSVYKRVSALKIGKLHFSFIYL